MPVIEFVFTVVMPALRALVAPPASAPTYVPPALTNACSAAAPAPAAIVERRIDERRVALAQEHAAGEVGRGDLADLRGRDALLLREVEHHLAVGRASVHWPSPVPWNAGFVGAVVPPV